MSKKLRRYSLRRIKDNYTYTVEQIADLFGINVNTVRRWISEEGLKRLPMTRPHLVHSSDLKRFLERKQKSRKKPCAEHELFCCKCQMPRSPKLDTGSLILNPNNTVLFGARCSVCDTKIHKAVKGEKWDENHP
ncbi:MAG: helix-turn-helix domain-containing protein [Alphaproteobacteria bacterium]|nr:helix-turn-helix domain-containing protein [Alphaproteobacteria bacterium]